MSDCVGCPNCGRAITPHRLDMRDATFADDMPLSRCAVCGFDLRHCDSEPLISYAADADQVLAKMVRKLEGEEVRWTRFEVEELAVFRHLTSLMTSRYKHDLLRQFVTDQLQVADVPLSAGHLTIEAREWNERRHLVQLAAWLLADLEHRLTKAWRAHSIRYNLLLKGLDPPPAWYRQIVEPMSNWRER